MTPLYTGIAIDGGGWHILWLFEFGIPVELCCSVASATIPEKRVALIILASRFHPRHFVFPSIVTECGHGIIYKKFQFICAKSCNLRQIQLNKLYHGMLKLTICDRCIDYRLYI